MAKKKCFYVYLKTHQNVSNFPADGLSYHHQSEKSHLNISAINMSEIFCASLLLNAGVMSCDGDGYGGAVLFCTRNAGPHFTKQKKWPDARFL